MWSEVNDNLHSFAALLKLINKPRNRTCVDRRELPVIELVVIALAICINILLVFQFSEWSFRTISPWKHNLYLLLDQVNSKHPYSALDICFVLLLTLREGWGYWIGWIFGKIPNGLPPPPPPSFLENYIAIFYDRYGCIYARRYNGWIVWNMISRCRCNTIVIQSLQQQHAILQFQCSFVSSEVNPKWLARKMLTHPCSPSAWNSAKRWPIRVKSSTSPSP